jgi:hypothetical protein
MVPLRTLAAGLRPSPFANITAGPGYPYIRSLSPPHAVHRLLTQIFRSCNNTTTSVRYPSRAAMGIGKVLHKEQTVFEMVEEVLIRQAKALVEQTGQTFDTALEAVSETDAGRQLRDLAEGPRRDERARDWQVGLARECAEERRYLWLEGYMEWLEGKEGQAEYYTLLEELASLRG